MSKEDRIQEQTFKEMEGLGDDGEGSSDEESDAGDETDLIENIQIQVPGAFRTKSILPLDDATASTRQGIQMDTMSNMVTVLGGPTDSDQPKEVNLRFKSLSDITGFPKSLMPHMKILSTEPDEDKLVGAPIIDSTFRLRQLPQYNLPTPSTTFDKEWPPW